MKHIILVLTALFTLSACGVDGEPSAPAPRASLTQ